MVTSDRLLQLVQELQRDVTVRQGRRTLLNYASSSTGAHLALLFAFDKARQALTLLERSGRRLPRQSPLSRNQYTSSKEQPRRISSLGLFGSVLQQRGLLYISSASAYSRSLEEERYWIGQDESIILSAIGEEQGVLVLCMGSKHTTQHKDAAHAQVNEGNLLVCATLLSAYLFTTDEKVEAPAGELSPLRLPPRISTSPSPMKTKSYEEQLHAALDQERRHIAHDLHDGVAQQLAHVIHKLEFIQLIMTKQPDVALREVVHASDILKASLKELRQDISSLLPAQLEEQGFEIALQGLLDEYIRSQPMLKLEYDADDLALVPLALGTPLFRFIQEALNNVRKHAQASRVFVRIRILSGLLVAEVSDNGRGFDVEQALARSYAGSAQHIGLRAMRDRVVRAGGSWEVQSKPAEGTSVKARFLLSASATALTHRERDVLRLLVQGLTNRAIAERLSVSVETVKSHVQHIMQKMQVNDRTQVAVIATKQQWL